MHHAYCVRISKCVHEVRGTASDEGLLRSSRPATSEFDGGRNNKRSGRSSPVFVILALALKLRSLLFTVMQPFDEVNFEASIYHFFLWKSEQEVKREEAARYQAAAEAAKAIQSLSASGVRSPANDGAKKPAAAAAKTPPVVTAAKSPPVAAAANAKPSPQKAPVADSAAPKKLAAGKTPPVAAAAKTPPVPAAAASKPSPKKALAVAAAGPKAATSLRVGRPVAAAPELPRSAKYMKVASLLAAEFPYLVRMIPPAQSKAPPEVYHRYAMHNQFQRDISALTAKNHQLVTQLDDSNKRPLVAPEEPPKKKRKHKLAPVSTKMQVGSRKDVPDDVKQLVTLLRKTARDEKAKADRKISRLVLDAAEAENKEWKIKQEAEQAARQEKLNQAAVQQLVPKKPAEPVLSFEERFKELEDFKKANGRELCDLRYGGRLIVLC